VTVHSSRSFDDASDTLAIGFCNVTSASATPAPRLRVRGDGKCRPRRARRATTPLAPHGRLMPHSECHEYHHSGPMRTPSPYAPVHRRQDHVTATERGSSSADLFANGGTPTRLLLGLPENLAAFAIAAYVWLLLPMDWAYPLRSGETEAACGGPTIGGA
jgi:hypothetical protein